MPYQIIGTAALCLIACLFILALTRTLLLHKKRPAAPAPVSDAARAEKFAQDLSAMLAVETVSPRGGRADKFLRLHETLEQLYPLCFAAMEKTVLPGGALLMHLKGQTSDGSIVLMSHSDVVPAPGEWKYPPFSGTIADGRIWGRGAVDTKGTLCAIFEALEWLLADGFTPRRDIYIASSSDEETSGLGAQRTVECILKSGAKIGLVIDEGGYVAESPLPGVKGAFAMLGIMEKGYADITVRAKGPGGHASTPPNDTPVARLAKFITYMETQNPFKTKITPPLRAMIDATAPYMSFGRRFIFQNLWLFTPSAKRILLRHPTAAAMLRTTVCFTQLTGSDTPNVIGQEATAVANVRFMMHEGQATALKKFKRIAARYGLECEERGPLRDYTDPVDIDGAAYQFVARVAADAFPEAVVTPHIVCGSTDSRFYTPHCMHVLRFSALPVSRAQLASMHAPDENIDVAALERGARFFRELLARLNEL